MASGNVLGSDYNLRNTQNTDWSNRPQIPTRRRGVCVTRDPAPTPVCRGVPGTITLALDPVAALTASASSFAFFAVLCDIHARSVARFTAPLAKGEKHVLLALLRHLGLQLGPLRKLAVGLPPRPALVEVLLPHRIKHGSELGCAKINNLSLCV